MKIRRIKIKKDIVVIYWKSEIGFGTLEIYYDDITNKYRINSEHLSKDKVKEILCSLVDGVELD